MLSSRGRLTAAIGLSRQIFGCCLPLHSDPGLPKWSPMQILGQPCLAYMICLAWAIQAHALEQIIQWFQNLCKTKLYRSSLAVCKQQAFPHLKYIQEVDMQEQRGSFVLSLYCGFRLFIYSSVSGFESCRRKAG